MCEGRKAKLKGDMIVIRTRLKEDMTEISRRETKVPSTMTGCHTNKTRAPLSACLKEDMTAIRIRLKADQTTISRRKTRLLFEWQKEDQNACTCL